jgi:hypothetical protein
MSQPTSPSFENPANAKPHAQPLVTPLVIAVTGHRDLVASEVPGITQKVKDFLQQLKKDYPHNRLSIMSPLAEGADMLVAEVAIELNIELIVPMPKSRDQYLADFSSEAGKKKFDALCAQATDVFELSYTLPPAAPGFSPEHWRISYPYANLGVFLCSHCHILLAIWDGKPSNSFGGTAQVVKFHHDDIMPGFTTGTSSSQQMLVDDESDLVFHIQCSREEKNNETNPAIAPLDCAWFTKDPVSPRSSTLPAQHELIFRRSSEFGADVEKYAHRIEAEKWPLFTPEQEPDLPPGAKDINQLYCMADWLAMHYQTNTLRTLTVTHVMAFLMGFVFILYSDLDAIQALLLAFLAFFGIAAIAQFSAKRGGWHRKYLDYRTLAEGLRVQFYWSVAGVTSSHKWKFAHDSYLQSQNPEFGWIRNIMRVAGMRSDAHPSITQNGLDFTLDEWVGGPDRGQLAYFRRKAQERIKRFALTERLGNLSLITSVITVFVFLLAESALSELSGNLLRVIMGSTLLLYGVREGYTYATATKELIKQYEFMFRIFDNAHRRLMTAQTQDEKREILSTLGQSALDEHSDWILMHRERSLDESEIWRMGS